MKRMKRPRAETPARLVLRRETLVVLTNVKLGAVHGGDTPSATGCAQDDEANTANLAPREQ